MCIQNCYYNVVWIAATSWGAGNKSYATLKNEYINYLMQLSAGQVYAELRGQQHTDRFFIVFSADAMPASESVMVCFSSQSASSAESGSDSVNCLSTSHHYQDKDHVQIYYVIKTTLYLGKIVQVRAYSYSQQWYVEEHLHPTTLKQYSFVNYYNIMITTPQHRSDWYITCNLCHTQ